MLDIWIFVKILGEMLARGVLEVGSAGMLGVMGMSKQRGWVLEYGGIVSWVCTGNRLRVTVLLILHIGVTGVGGVAELGLVLASWVMGVVGYVVIPCTWVVGCDGGLIESRPFAGDHMFIDWAGTVD